MDDILAKLTEQSTILSKQTEKLQQQSIKLDTLDNIKQKINVLSVSLETLSNKITNIEKTQTTQGSEITTIKADLDEARTEINMLKQQNLNSEFVIYGLPPEVTTEESKEIIKNLSDTIGVDLNDNQILRSYARHNARNTESMIVGSFTNPAIKDQMKKAFNQKKPVVVEDVIKNLFATSKWRGKEVVMRNQLTEYNHV